MSVIFKLQDTQPLAYNDDASGWKLLIHDQRDSPLIHLRTHGTTLYRGWSKDIRVFIRQVSFDIHTHYLFIRLLRELFGSFIFNSFRR